MSQPKNHLISESYGNISIVDLGTKELRSGLRTNDSASVKHCQHTWTPSDSIRGNLPANLAIRFDCYVDEQGNRRFAPAEGYEPLIQFGYLAGLAILRKETEMSWEQCSSYRNAKFTFDIARSMKERYQREFRTAKDLFVYTKSKRLERHVLPVDLGLNLDGTGRPWNAQTLIARGLESAQADGVTRCTRAIAIQYGLHEGARRNPLKLRGPQISPLIRRALFDIGKKAARSLVEKIEARFLNALEEHLDDPTDKFRNWCYGPKSNLMKSLANQAQDGKRKVAISDVRVAMLELGWNSYAYISQCLHAFFRWFEKAAMLTPQETKIFRLMYFPQKVYGNLPLVLLVERLDILGMAVNDLWRGKDPREVARIVYRLLHYYSHMMSIRRDADRTMKRPHDRDHTNDPSVSDDDVTTKAVHNERLNLIFVTIAQQRRIHCIKQNCKLRGDLVSNTRKKVKAKITCDCGKVDQKIVVSMDEVNRMGHELASMDDEC